VIGPDGDELRGVAAEPDNGRAIDLKRAYALTLQKSGATVEA
jgi:hypothetical protein